jgi:class 3 adenylate cyclase/tetratricopeptide (TPR) repeat protein
MTVCASCSADLPVGARFCLECGTPVGRSCPACGAPADRGRFCGDCGTPLEPAAQDPASTHERPVAERRVTSVLFGDLVGFTPLSESRDAEEVRELLSRYFAECRTVIGRYGGTVEKFIGDAVMAVWGVPTAHEDDAERAVRAGLELASVVAGLGEDVGAPGLAMRVGVVTGEVAVTIGATSEGMVAGDAVNTAARVQSAAEPGTVWVDEATRSLTAAAIAYDDTGEHELKGKSEPMRLFAARAVVAEVGGGQRVDGLEAPLTGRDREMRLLKELFHSTEESQRPRLVVLDGEAGVGKSRMAWEFEKYADGLAADTRWHRGRCLSYGDAVAFWPLAEAVRARLGLTEGDSGDVVSDKLDAGLATFIPDAEEREWMRPRLAALVRAGSPGDFTRPELFIAWTTWFERVGADSDSVVLVVDDSQYADDALLDFLEHLLAHARSGVFVLALSRPELLTRRPGLGGRRGSVIRLDPLDDDAMARLVDGLVAGLSPDARTALVSRAEGVPLFAVETVRALIDRDVVVPRDGRYVSSDSATLDLDAIGAPASLQALVAARVDALSADERHVVADASVLGAVFSREGLLALGNDPVRLDPCLESLQRKEILAVQQDRFAADRGQFRFVQSVVRQVVYSTQSRRDRKARHLAVADFMSDLPDADGDLAMVIGQHLLDAVDASSTGDADVADLMARACALLEKAAIRARGLGSMAEAHRLFVAALDRAVHPVDRARLTLGAADAAQDAGDYATARDLAGVAAALYDDMGLDVEAGFAAAVQTDCTMALLDPAAAIAIALPRWNALQGTPGAERVLLRLSARLAAAYTEIGDNDSAWEVTNRRIRLAEAYGDPGFIAQAMLGLGVGYHSTGAPETSRALTEAAAALCREHDRPAVLSQALNNLASLLASRDLPAARAAAREGLEVARRSGIAGYVDYTAINRTISLWLSGRLEEVADLVDDARDWMSFPLLRLFMEGLENRVAAARGLPLTAVGEPPVSGGSAEFVVWADHAMQVAMAAGDVERAAELAEQSLPLVLSVSGIDDDFIVFWPPMVLAAVATGDVARAERMLAPVETASPGIVSLGVAAEWHWLRGLVFALRGDPPAAVEAELRTGIGALDAFGAVGMRARAQEDLASWLVAQGRAIEAESVADQARATYVEIGAHGWLATLDAWRSTSVRA